MREKLPSKYGVHTEVRRVRGYPQTLEVRTDTCGNAGSGRNVNCLETHTECCVGVRLCDMYSNQELAEIHFMYGKADGNAFEWLVVLPGKVPTGRQCPDRKHLYVSITVCANGKFNSPGLGRGRPRSTTPVVQEEILEAVK
ncbi:hypothetical protein ANN_20987 [Periplaneta americana]|uniref:Uncharacterized protein n=1 Tax=Periplaneta americana TaxID=6978 RepID=A0ABQ8SEJ9_PERAM|nr:hypothetical protein ANN_20987 [Periplaneta americana]